MPDLTAVNKFHGQMVDIETAFLRDARRIYASFRQDALDLIDSAGLASPQLNRLIRGLLDQMAAQIRQLADEYTARLIATSDEYARQSLAIIHAAAPSFPEFETVQRSIGSEPLRESVIREFTNTAANFVEVISARFVLALDEARQTPDDPQAVRLLLSPGLVNGRASVYRHGINALAYEGQRKIWTAALGLATVYFLKANEQATGPDRLQKQAVAIIDDWTTECCLNVHGQIQDIDQPFELSGSPCGEDKMHPPFPDHRCRTVEAPYLPVLEKSGLTTGEMVASAMAEAGRRR
jgi:hypothetical protein